MTEVPDGVERDYPLARLTTVRAGGAAELFARPTTAGRAGRAAGLGRRARRRGSRWSAPARTSWSPTAASAAWSSSSPASLRRSSARAPRSSAAAAFACPRRRRRLPRWGLTGLEFGINIPGTVGGAVRMNANAYGGELARVLDWVDVCTAAGVERRRPDRARLLLPALQPRPGQVVSRPRSSSSEPSRRRSRPPSPRCARKRREAQPSGIKTFGSTFKNPDDERAEGRTAGQLLEAAGCRGLTVGGARLSPKHANFVENAGEATTADVLAVMAAGRRACLRALRGRARARGPGARRGRVACRLGAGTRALRAGAGARGVN